MKTFIIFVMLFSASMTNPTRFLGLLPRQIERTADYCNVKTCAPPYKGEGSTMEDHTLCKKGFKLDSTGPACNGANPFTLSSTDQKTIVDEHNTLRSKVALGQLEGQPIATNMRQLKWDDELAEIAQTWANQCTNEHDKCNNVDRFSVGQNIGWGASSDPALVSTQMTSAIKDWFNENKDFDAKWIAGEWSSAPVDPNRPIGHYTQMVWAETYLIGCAGIQYEGNDVGMKYEAFVVCNYGPAGNTVGEPVYKTGTEAASDCQPGTKANTETGLCEGEASADSASGTKPTDAGSGGAVPTDDSSEGSKPTDAGDEETVPTNGSSEGSKPTDENTGDEWIQWNQVEITEEQEIVITNA